MPAAELINTLLILGAAQGLFLAVVLASKRTNHAANRLLAVAMLAFSIYIHQGVYYAREWYLGFPHLIEISQPLIYVFGPVFYLYARALTEKRYRFTKASLFHFAPAALVALYYLPLYLRDGPSKIALLRSLLSDGRPPDLGLIELLQYPQGILYAILTIGVLRRHRARLRDTYSWVERVNLVWLRNLTIGIAGAWMLATTLYVLEIAGFRIGQMEPMLTRLAVSVIVYGVGYFGLRQPEIFQPPVHRKTAEYPVVAAVPAEGIAETSVESLPPATTAAPPTLAVEPAPDEGTLYGKSGLSEGQAAAYERKLLRLMDEKRPYRNSYLTLQELADELSVSAHNLSQVINTRLGKNFYDFVNGYRVEEVKHRLRDPTYQHLTILAIGLEAGFNTKSTFNAFFKKHTGVTPSRYREQDQSAAA
jgi:AraC-like DNA-binding protein